MEKDTGKLVDGAIRGRQTVKILSDTPVESDLARRVVEALIESAAWAPFHRPASKHHVTNTELSSKVPWRFYILNGANCRRLREILINRGDKTKVPAMLAAASTLIQATWLPDPSSQECDALFDATLENMEHIAAASAAVQNLLVSAAARGIPSYWSSGGCLRKQEQLDLLGIPLSEILLGSIFLFPEPTEDFKVSKGKLRDKRGSKETWSRWVDLE